MTAAAISRNALDPRSNLHALIEAQLMSEAIEALADLLTAKGAGDSFPILEAIKACVMRLATAVDPVVEKMLSDIDGPPTDATIGVSK